MTYYESAEGEVITRARAIRELRRHGVGDSDTIAQFYAEVGEREEYDAQEVLNWLGY